MWKYVSRRIKDSFERGVNYFDVRGSVGVAAPANNVDNNKQVKVVSKEFVKTECYNNPKTNKEKAHQEYWYYDYQFFLQRWFGAISLSSALVVGWYANQILHLRRKCCLEREHAKNRKLTNAIVKNLSNIKWSLGCCAFTAPINKPENIELSVLLNKSYNNKRPTNAENLKTKFNISVINNESSSKESSDSDLSNVLNSIENKLGLAAIEHGQMDEGLMLLRSAAKRKHPPALFNLALCYENGLGLQANENMAMELYKSAAILEHPTALYNLAVYYGQGRGGLKIDIETAERLLRIAANKGQEDAIKALKSFDENEPAQSKFFIQNDIELGNSSLIV